ncbi:MAG: hypothetical protein JNL12_19525 [Planctomycetes bacterium]|nr:hypothetical protein [Planctomycetota bacterium]
MRAQALAAAALVSLASCTADQAFRIGAGVGATLSPIDVDARGISSADSLSFDARGEGGFVEVMATGNSADLILRLSAQEGSGSIAGVATDGEVRTQRASLLLSTPFDLFGTGTLRPFFGVSAGHLEVQFDELLPYQRGHHLTGGIVLGVECELAYHLLVGCSVAADAFGAPGATDGTLIESLAYVGVRF